MVYRTSLTRHNGTQGVKQRHSDGMFATDDFGDRRRWVGGGVCVYVSNAYESCLYKFDSTYTSRLPPDIELIWIQKTSRFSSDVEHVGFAIIRQSQYINPRCLLSPLNMT